MKSAVLSGESVWIVPFAPDWQGTPRLTVVVPADVNRGATAREDRFALGGTLRANFEWSATLTGAQRHELLWALQAAENRRIVVPIWPFRVRGADWAAAPVKGGLGIAWKADWSEFNLFVGEFEEDPEEWDFIAPALLGVFAEDPEPGAATDDLATVEFSFQEDAPADFALWPADAPNSLGPAIPGAANVPAFPWEVDWNTAPRTGGAVKDVSRQTTELSREAATAFYPQAGERPVRGTVYLHGRLEIARLLGWWQARAGIVQEHWVSTLAAVGRLGASAAAGATEIELVGASAVLGENRFIALHERASGVVEIAKITDVDGDVLTLSAPLAHAFRVGLTRVSLAMLARHSSDRLRIDFANPEAASAELRWREVAPEYAVPVGESRGVTLGSLPRPVWLYRFRIQHAPGSVEIVRVTSYERNVDADDATWTYRKGFDQSGAYRQSLDLSRQDLTIKARWWDGCPFQYFLPGKLNAVVYLDAFEGVIADPGEEVIEAGNVSPQWSARIREVEFDGPFITAKLAGPNEVFERMLPGDTFGPNCNAQLFDSRCTLAEAAWEHTALVTAIAGHTVTIGTIARAGGLAAGFGFAHWFALGRLGYNVGGYPRRWPIYDSAALAGGEIVLTLRSPFPGLVGQAVSLWPGCDGRRETCRAYHADDNPEGKFDNFVNRQAFDFIPDRSPSFTPPKRSAVAAGKK